MIGKYVILYNVPRKDDGMANAKPYSQPKHMVQPQLIHQTILSILSTFHKCLASLQSNRPITPDMTIAAKVLNGNCSKNGVSMSNAMATILAVMIPEYRVCPPEL